MQSLKISPGGSARGSFRAPADKSLTHRAYLFAAIANGPCQVMNPLRGEDCENTRQCLEAMGMHSVEIPDGYLLKPVLEWRQPDHDLECGNSGTTMRLLSGLISSRPITATLVGDASLSRRPMKRIATPLELMGASIEGERPPLKISGAQLNGISYFSPVASAQIKSCVLLAGLRADGETSVTEPAQSRNHTEIMLKALGAEIKVEGLKVTVKPSQLKAFTMSVPGDISSAAFLMVLGVCLPGSEITIQNVGINPSRTGILDVLNTTGANCFFENVRSELGEEVADFRVQFTKMRHPFVIEGAMVPRLVDEIPVLALLATQCQGKTIIRDAQELKVKESDRIAMTATLLNSMGAEVATTEDGLEITGPTPLHGTTFDADGDHRMAMTAAIAGILATTGDTLIHGADSIRTSFPEFESILEKLLVK